ncbi:TPA: hypothetical protein JI054_11040 [Acinetobacter baumannii]|nr:hypothetical protein B7L35_15825 [Acinetobacter baumannii]ENW45879.1 hypothetical protein F920_00734 [Acinetobacter baumannii NIPH 335]EZF16065.1 hypothetical protein BA71_01254 [Acinetobacter baumannii LAC-4]HBX4478844.1 hypothetical protein [Klebsiella pneumoniae]AXX44822.1 hypothetical protein Aba10324_07575 [Acinetobacter baumannii]
MKDTYLLIYTRYKFLIFSVYTLISTLGIFVQYIKEVLSISSVLVIFSSTFFCLYAWFNGTFTFVFAIDVNSSTGEVYRRWCVILFSSLFYVYTLIDPFL